MAIQLLDVPDLLTGAVEERASILMELLIADYR
jgi:hypothetical protein